MCEKLLTGYQPVLGGPVTVVKRDHGPPKNGRAYKRIELPCGQCILCRLEHARQWAVRITHEAQLHDENCFLTLTYNDDNLPHDGSLHYPHLQKFWKRLRKRLGKPLRYYAVGEYGDNTQRAHYHACLFGHAFLEDRIIVRHSPTLLWTNPLLIDCWGHGENVSAGALTFESAQYTASYVTKKLNNARQYVKVDELTGELIPLIQPRALMSLKPAIGRAWLDQYGGHTYAHDRVVINGRPQKPPKYYDRWLEKENKEQHSNIKQRRQQHTTKLTPEQTHARAQNAHARAKIKSKSV